jgi:group I intron endonuclease
MQKGLNISGIYQIKNKTNGKSYIGSSINIRLRWKDHRRKLRKGIHHSKHLQSSFDKYGLDSFEFLIIEKVDDLNNLLKSEQKWIDFYQSYDRLYGYNSRKFASSNWMLSVSDETREKLKKSHLGKKRSKECHKKILASISKKVYQLDKETLEKINEFSSCKEGEEKTGIARQLISMACRGITKSAKGYCWTYDIDNFKKPEKYNILPKVTRFIIDQDTGNEWKTIKEAAEYLNLTKNQIYSLIKWKKLIYEYRKNY